MKEAFFDVIVVGLGGMGSAALYELARRGRRVLGIEQFGLVHDQGSSHGHSRIIRQAYYEHPDYVPLVKRALERWRDLEQTNGKALLTPCPCLSVGPAGSDVVEGVVRSANDHHLAVERLSGEDLARCYPQFRFEGSCYGVLESTAGVLFVEDCVNAHLDEARRLGALIHANEPVVDWRPLGSGIEICTAHARYGADRLVVAAGPWAAGLLAGMQIPLTVMRQVMLWFEPSRPDAFRIEKFLVFIAETKDGYFYGVPMLNGWGVKIAQHYGAEELAGPDLIDRTVHGRDEEVVRRFVGRHLPDALGPVRRSSICIYTLTPDRHFILDLHPECSRVAVAAGFSGHGFKFSPVIGEVMADLVEVGKTDLPIERFRADRFKSK